jgi:hypothetical protein
MKYSLASAVSFFLIGATPALSTPEWVYDYCWAQAARIRFNGRGDREHFMANCIADYTPTPTRKPRYRRSY